MKHSNVHYILKNTSFCNCEYYESHVIKSKAEFCHHFLATILAEALKTFKERKLIKNYEFLTMYKVVSNIF